MVVTCASCLTKFSLDDSKIPAKGTKVRCSRCKHVFYIMPPARMKEEIIEDIDTFSKYHEELIEPDQEKKKISPRPTEREKEPPSEEKLEGFFFPDEMAPEKIDRTLFLEEEKTKEKAYEPRKAPQKKRKGLSLVFSLLVILLVLVFGVFYLWRELESGGRLSTYFESPIKKIGELWQQAWGIQKEGLVIGDLSGFEEKNGEASLYVIKGKVSNQSTIGKKFVKVKVAVYDQNRTRVALQETLCVGPVAGREKQPPPSETATTEENIILPGGVAYFRVVFEGLSTQPKEFKVEIAEAPDL